MTSITKNRLCRPSKPANVARTFSPAWSTVCGRTSPILGVLIFFRRGRNWGPERRRIGLTDRPERDRGCGGLYGEPELERAHGYDQSGIRLQDASGAARQFVVHGAERFGEFADIVSGCDGAERSGVCTR